jgi:hypothetical protein
MNIPSPIFIILFFDATLFFCLFQFHFRYKNLIFLNLNLFPFVFSQEFTLGAYMLDIDIKGSIWSNTTTNYW